MVLTITIPLRAVYHLEDFVTARHLDIIAKFTLVTGLVVDYSYVIEHFIGWYSGNPFEEALLTNRAFGPYGFWYWVLLFCNMAVTQFLWFKRVHSSIWLLFMVSILINIGMWTERFIIVVGSPARDFLPAAWGEFAPTIFDWSFLLGTLGLFGSLMFPVRARGASYSGIRDAAPAARTRSRITREIIRTSDRVPLGYQHDMPAFGDILSDDYVSLVVTYIRSIGPAGPIPQSPPAILPVPAPSPAASLGGSLQGGGRTQ